MYVHDKPCTYTAVAVRWRCPHHANRLFHALRAKPRDPTATIAALGPKRTVPLKNPVDNKSSAKAAEKCRKSPQINK